MKYRSFLIKYAEIGVKGKNRYLFEDALVKQIHHRLKNLEGKFEVTKEAGRIYAEASEDFDYDEVIDALQHVFGIVGICPVVLLEDEGFDKLAEEGAELLIRTIPSIVDGTAVYTKQPEESPTPYAAMISKKMGLMDFTKSATELERLVRGMNPWPSAYTFLNGKTLKVWKCSVESGNCGKEAPGTITGVDKKGIHVACGTDKLVLEEVQLEGKKRMETDAFLRGYQVTEGIMLKDHKE